MQVIDNFELASIDVEYAGDDHSDRRRYAFALAP